MNLIDDITYDIFISYAWEDGFEYAQHLETELMQSGFRVWRDPNIRKSADFTAEIEKAIRASKLVLVVMTDYIENNEKSFVRREISYAEIKGKPIQVARFNRAMIVQLANHTYVDFVEQEWDSAYPLLIKAIRNELGSVDAGTYQPPALPISLQSDPYRQFAKETYELASDLIEQTTIFEQEIDLLARTDLSKVGKSAGRSSLRRAYKRMGKTRSASTDLTSLSDALEEYAGRLLLLGQPGSGKTTSLLALSRDLASARLHNPSAPLPVFAFISSWDVTSNTPFFDWLAQETEIEAEQLKVMFDEEKVILLLDGLDELIASQVEETESGQIITYDPRQRFMAMIPPHGLIVISSRIEEYEEIGTQLTMMNGAITLENLTDDQIQAYLTEMPALWDVLNGDRSLLEIARTPLLLSLFAFGFRNAPESAKGLRDLRGAELRNAIFTNYINQRYEHEMLRADAMGEYIPFTLDDIYQTLGHVAMLNASSGTLRTHEQNFTQERMNTFSIMRDNQLVSLDFAEALGSQDAVDEFVDFMLRLQLLVQVDNELRFVHLRLRDTLVSLYCDYDRVFNPDNYRFTFEASPARALGSLPDGEGFELLAKLLYSDLPVMIRSSAARGLGKTRLPEARDVLVKLLDTETHYHVIRSTLSTLGYIIKDAKSEQALVDYLHDKSRPSRDQAAVSLGNIGTTSARDLLIELLKDATEDVKVLSGAIKGLHDMGDEISKQTLLDRFRIETDTWLLSEIVWALGGFFDEDVYQVLEDAIQDETYRDVWDSLGGALYMQGRERALLKILTVPAPMIDLDGRDIHTKTINRLERKGSPEAREAVKNWRNSRKDPP